MGGQSDRIRTAWRQSPAIKAAARAALELVLPLTGFDGGAAQSPGLSGEAWRRIVFISDPACDGCGLPFEYDTGARCGACQAKPKVFTGRGRPASMTRTHAT